MNETLSILIIEDDADTLANLCDILGLDGHSVVAASSLKEARQLLESQAFSVVITDRKLPDGLIEDLLPELDRLLGGAEVIVITGFADMESTITAFRLGVTDYVIKPIIPDDLLRTVRRIAEKRRLESELEKEHAFAELVLNTAEAIVLVLSTEGRVVQFNPYLEQLTGWTMDELAGKDWFDNCIAEGERQRIKEVFLNTAKDLRTRGVVNGIVGKDGRIHQIRWSNTTLKASGGGVSAVLAVGVDISDLAAAQGRALQAERLAAIGQTMTALAHESRNALQRIQAASEMLGLEIGENENAAKDLDAIQRANNDLKCLLEEVRSFAAPIQMSPVLMRLPQIWRRVWSDLSLTVGNRDVELIELIGECDVEVEVDLLRMEQVFRNLFENALAACEDPVKISLTCQHRADHIEFSMLDNGPGMSADQLDKLFQPFFTTKPTGTGLGLSICQRIVEAHGGSICADSLESGAKFTLKLPLRKSVVGSPCR